MSTALTESIDVAQVVLYLFWGFFFGLIYWLRREDRREGFPVEEDSPRRVGRPNFFLIPAPKVFQLPHGGTYTAPNLERDEREINAERTSRAAGSPLEPHGDALMSGVGPASFANRVDRPELTSHGDDLIVPLRVAGDFAVLAGPDPRGWNVRAADGKVAGTIKELWVDRADVMVRYLEMELGEVNGESGVRLIPMTMVLLDRDAKAVDVYALRAEHFMSVPRLKEPDRITVLEEERVSAFYAGGRLYADPKRMGPLL